MTDDFVFELIEKFNTSDIVDFEFSRDGSHLSLKKKEGCKYQTLENNINNNDSSSINNINQKKDDEDNTKETLYEENKCKSEYLKSPIVGTFYRSPSPDSPAYAEKGKIIKKGEPICIIEAMKMMNTLNADYDLEIADILVKNGDLVEYEQPLFSINKL